MGVYEIFHFTMTKVWNYYCCVTKRGVRLFRFSSWGIANLAIEYREKKSSLV